MKKSKELLSGNEAVVRGALAAGLGFFSGYPITPASEIMHEFAKYQSAPSFAEGRKIEFLQAEDELAAINMCIGASLAGAKAMTATSGPGFSLMQESIGFAFKIGAPLVIVNSQRVGPSTGMPTLGAQGDILQARHGSHGDYTNIVFYPNSVEECYRYTIEALNAAEEALSPVILLLDGHLSRLYETAGLEKDVKLKKRSLKPLGTGSRHFTGLTSKGNVPATKDAKVYREWYRKRKKEILNAAEKYSFYEYHENRRADTLLIAYGIVSRVVLSLKSNYSVFRPIRLFPIVRDLEGIAKKYKRIVAIEMNDGQYRHELEAFLKRKVDLVSQLGGRVSLEEIKNGIEQIR